MKKWQELRESLKFPKELILVSREINVILGPYSLKPITTSPSFKSFLSYLSKSPTFLQQNVSQFHKGDNMLFLKNKENVGFFRHEFILSAFISSGLLESYFNSQSLVSLSI